MNNKVLAFIPARANSKGVKNKNIKKLNGEPLVSRTIDFAKKNWSSLITSLFARIV